MLREQAVEIAKRQAKAHQPSYYTGDDFEPHEQVIQAILDGSVLTLMDSSFSQFDEEE